VIRERIIEGVRIPETAVSRIKGVDYWVFEKGIIFTDLESAKYALMTYNGAIPHKTIESMKTKEKEGLIEAYAERDGEKGKAYVNSLLAFRKQTIKKKTRVVNEIMRVIEQELKNNDSSYQLPQNFPEREVTTSVEVERIQRNGQEIYALSITPHYHECSLALGEGEFAEALNMDRVLRTMNTNIHFQTQKVGEEEWFNINLEKILSAPSIKTPQELQKTAENLAEFLCYGGGQPRISFKHLGKEYSLSMVVYTAKILTFQDPEGGVYKRQAIFPFDNHHIIGIARKVPPGKEKWYEPILSIELWPPNVAITQEEKEEFRGAAEQLAQRIIDVYPSEPSLRNYGWTESI